MAHVVPFQPSASAPESLRPTATQVVADGHETALRVAVAAVKELLCGGLGVCWIAQDFPFQRSARVTVPAGSPRAASPTEVQATGEEQEIP